MLFDISLSNIILDLSRQAMETKAKINTWDYIQLKSFCTVKETLNNIKRQPNEWEKIFANDVYSKEDFSGGTVVKNPPPNAGDTGDVGLIPGLGRSSGIEDGNPLQYSCLENSMDIGAWWVVVHGVTKSQTRLSTYTI